MHHFWTMSLLFLLLAGCGKTAEEPAQVAVKTQAPAREEEKPYDFSQELTEEKARELIPLASSLSQQEYLDILKHPPLRLGEIKNQTLTALLLAIDPFLAAQQNSHVKGDFHYLTLGEETPDAKLIRKAIQGKPGAEFVTLIQPDDITKCTCLSQGDSARGRVDYRAGSLYEGSADFTAQRQGEKWQIIAFSLPEYRLVTHRKPDGLWRLDSEEQLLGVAWP